MAPVVLDCTLDDPQASSFPSSKSVVPPTPPTASFPHDIYLILTFPTLDSFLYTTLHLPVISKEAERSSGLLVLIRFSRKVFMGVGNSEDTANADNRELDESSASSPIAASSSSKSVEDDGNRIYPSSIFHRLQEALSKTYSAATQAFIEEGRPLAIVDVVIEELREIGVCVPDRQGVRVSRWSPPALQTKEANARTGGAAGDISEPSDTKRRMFSVTALGGTFDHLHAGHKVLLTMAAVITSQRLIVGTTDEVLLTKKKFSAYIEPLERRIAGTRSFLELVRPTIKHNIVAIQDVYGPTAWDPQVEALVLSEETRAGGEAIEQERRKKNLSTLEIFIIDLISEDADVKGKVESKMGSTGIREWLSKNMPKEKQKTD